MYSYIIDLAATCMYDIRSYKVHMYIHGTMYLVLVLVLVLPCTSMYTESYVSPYVLIRTEEPVSYHTRPQGLLTSRVGGRRLVH